jgi:hypothetical protein
MGSRAPQRRKRVHRASKSVSFVREDEPEYTLPGIALPSVESVSQISKLNGGFKDSAFGDNKSRPIHRWIPWIAGFSSEFVRDVFSQYLAKNHSSQIAVLDPFCGVHATLVEVQLNCY